MFLEIEPLLKTKDEIFRIEIFRIGHVSEDTAGEDIVSFSR